MRWDNVRSIQHKARRSRVNWKKLPINCDLLRADLNYQINSSGIVNRFTTSWQTKRKKNYLRWPPTRGNKKSSLMISFCFLLSEDWISRDRKWLSAKFIIFDRRCKDFSLNGSKFSEFMFTSFRRHNSPSSFTLPWWTWLGNVMTVVELITPPRIQARRTNSPNLATILTVQNLLIKLLCISFSVSDTSFKKGMSRTISLRSFAFDYLNFELLANVNINIVFLSSSLPLAAFRCPA